MASSSSSNPSLNPNTRSRRRRKKMIMENATTQSPDNDTNQTTIQWKSHSQQQLYSTKLLHALRRVQIGNGTSTSPPAPTRVRQAADRVLAFTAKGRSRWSRAILMGGSSRLKLKFMKRNNMAKQQRRVANMTTSSTRVVVTGDSRLQRKSKAGVVRLKGKDLPAVQRKAKVLGGLVPGCRKQPLNVVLEEASDYIAALEMQVRAMSRLADLLSVSGSSSSSTVSTSAHHSDYLPDQLNSNQDLP